MKKIINYCIIALMGLCMLASCSDVELPDAVVSDGVTNLQWSADGRALTLSWELPAGADSAIVYKDNSLLAKCEKGATSYYIKRAEVNKTNLYTVKAAYADGRVSEGQTVSVNISYTVNTKVGFLLLADDVNSLTDDDELACAKWFNDNYVANGTGVFIKYSEVGNLSADDISCLMVMVDRVGLKSGVDNLPSQLRNALPYLKAYVQDDGNMVCYMHATQVVEGIGRTNGFLPNAFGNGSGSDNSDVWGINAVIGGTTDHTSHAIYEGMESGDFIYGHSVFATEGAGVKEDHNCMWTFADLGLSADNNTTAFEEATTSTVLGTWGQETDNTHAGIVEFAPTGDYTGRIIAIGMGCCEFNQAGGNLYQKDVELLLSNSINYLK